MIKNIVLLAIFLLFVFGASDRAQASDYANMRHPLFENVDRVYVHVDQNIYPQIEEQLPPAFHVGNIKKLLLDLYKQRFSSDNCAELLRGKNPYSCNDQPVTLIDDGSVFNENSVKFDKSIKDPGTLNVALRVHVVTNRKSYPYDPPLASPIIVFSIQLYRADQKLPFWSGPRPRAFPVNQNNESLEMRLKSFIKQSIY